MSRRGVVLLAVLVAVSACGPSDRMLEILENGQAAEAELSAQLSCETKIGISQKNSQLETATVFVSYDCLGDRTPETVRSMATPIIAKHFGSTPESVLVNIQSEQDQ